MASRIREVDMSKGTTHYESDRLQTREERDAILAELQQVLASPHFCNSKRYPALLQFVVENTLAGRSDQLKERTLGVEVFDRPAAYDTNSDTVVRYTAGEVRKRLSMYYHEQGRDSRIRISLPAGSYVPEFLHLGDDTELDAAGMGSPRFAGGEAGLATPADDGVEPEASAVATSGSTKPIATPMPTSSRGLWWMLAAIVVVGLAALVGWRAFAGHSQTALDEFWAPILKDQKTVSICTGSVVFANNNFSGVITASKDIEYPFVSMQIASSISQLSDLLGRKGTAVELLSAPSTPLTGLREHPDILVGGYNNQWTERLLQPLPIRLGPEVTPSIIDRRPKQGQWSRDQSQPYSSADDYALIARFRDPTTDSWLVVLAGLGRNGTEAASQFATSPHYMQLLKDQLGGNLVNHNLEVVLKVRVIDGKTGAPSIVAAHSW